MNVNPTTSAGGATTGATAQATPPQSALGTDTFLKLLVTQLQHQDPTKPQDDTQFLTQLAQFSSLEKLTSIEESVTALDQAFLDPKQS